VVLVGVGVVALMAVLVGVVMVGIISVGCTNSFPVAYGDIGAGGSGELTPAGINGKPGLENKLSALESDVYFMKELRLWR
jgi:hypothetical protein